MGPRPERGPGEAEVALFGATRRKPVLDDCEALAAFIDAEAEAFARGAVDDYARARARTDSLELFARAGFAARLAAAHAEAYPFALTMVAEMIESALAAQARDRAAQLRALIVVAHHAFDRQPAPLPAPAWSAARDGVVRWLADVTCHPPRITDEIAEPFLASMLALMPLDEALGPDDVALLRGAIRATLATIRDRFIAIMDAPALAAALAASQ